MTSKFKSFQQELGKTLSPFKDIIWFLSLYIVLTIVWKLIVNFGILDPYIFVVLGKDFTYAVQPICDWTANAVYWIIHDLMGYSNFQIDGTIINFPNSFRQIVVWECTGIREVFIFTIIMMCCYGPWKKKLIFIPISIIILNLLNILRIVALSFIVKDDFPNWFISFNEWYNNRTWISMEVSRAQFARDWFQMFHGKVFEWLYYDGVMFMLWLFWQEKINLPFQRRKKALESANSDQQN